MSNSGARQELLTELRRVGGSCWEAALRLEVDVHMVEALPNSATFLAIVTERVLICSTELSLWAGLAHFVALDLGLTVGLATLCDVAALMSQSSGFLLASSSA